jgi:hypothetical protein
MIALLLSGPYGGRVLTAQPSAELNNRCSTAGFVSEVL